MGGPLSCLAASSDMMQRDKLGTLTFKHIVTDIDGSKYLIGEVTNNDPNNRTIESTVYFSNESVSYSKYMGQITAGMGIPFKIPVHAAPDGNVEPSPSAIKVSSRIVAVPQPARDKSLLAVNYDTLVMDNETHSISGMLDNKSPVDAYGVRVSAIAIDKNAKVLDVVESKVIPRIPGNSSSPFTLVPMKSIAGQVGYYSCFVPSQSGLNFTLPIEDNQTVQIEVGSDAKIRNVTYDKATHSINFDAQGIFRGGGWVAVMFIAGPNSIVDSNYTVLVNGQNTTKASVSSSELSPGRFYRHVDVVFPYGVNTISMVATSTVPEFPIAPSMMLSGLAVAVMFGFFVRSRSASNGSGTG